VAKPEDDYPDAASGRAALEPNLRAWEFQLELGRGMWVEFRYESAEVIDPPGATRRVRLAAHHPEDPLGGSRVDVARGVGGTNTEDVATETEA